MLNINEYLINKKTKEKKIEYKYFPNTKDELRDLIHHRIDTEGPTCDLNDIDISKISKMRWLFSESEFNGDISQWDVSHITDMRGMFADCKFNGDISKWNVSNVEHFAQMFRNNKHFTGDISKWNVQHAIDFALANGDIPFLNMFENSKLEEIGKVPKWYNI